MSDRFKGCIVAFDHDIRDDDAEALLIAIGMIRGVSGVKLGTPTDYNDMMIRMQLKTDLLEKFHKFIRENFID